MEEQKFPSRSQRHKERKNRVLFAKRIRVRTGRTIRSRASETQKKQHT